MDEMTSPETEVIEQQTPETEVTEQVETEESELETAEESTEAEQDDAEDIEYEGKQYRLPKELKEALLRQSDYTKKTQEVAEQRRQIERQQQEFQQRVQIQQQTLQDHAHLMTLDQQLQQFEQLDWNKVIDEDPVQALKLQQQFTSLKGMREQVATRINHFQQQQFQQQQAKLAKQMESGVAELKRDIANWSPELAQKIQKHSVEKLGFSDDEMSKLVDPRYVKVLHKAFLYDQLISQKQAKPQPETQKPVTTVKAKTTTATKDPDKMTPDEWRKWREAELRKRK